MEVGFRLADVFTERPFAGNQLCVVPEPPPDLTSEQMQAIAREIGFSETTFVTHVAVERYEMRIFTPAAEIPFAGHPTLGTAFTLVSEGRIGSRGTQTTTAGDVAVEVDLEHGFARMQQLPPRFGSEFSEVELIGRATGLGREDMHPELPMQVISTGLAPLLVPVRDEAAFATRGARRTRVRRSGRACRRGVPVPVRDPWAGRRDGPHVRSLHGDGRGRRDRFGRRAPRRLPVGARNSRHARVDRDRARRDGRPAELPACRRAPGQRMGRASKRRRPDRGLRGVPLVTRRG